MHNNDPPIQGVYHLHLAWNVLIENSLEMDHKASNPLTIPMIVPKKRTAMLVDRLMVALKEAIDEEEAQMANSIIDNPSRTKPYALSPEDVRTMDLQRRGHGSLSTESKVRPYWRCYFNAVTCF
ncbi:hypothetical protein WA026_001903 [Henosepilachna vigintioctopunctata]|uniref:Uncharacterized protein n=1 Tax=Henosepilachna vigintioctopunctata TaxID=420089 RepID=A0AAW1USF4_9CUCU